jgi:tetratricopeptide (TPR) repeat protein
LTQLGATPEQALQVRQWMEEAAEAAKAGRVEDTQRAFERVLSVLPTHAAANFGMGLMAAKRGQTIDAARMLKKGLEGDPDYYPALFLLAEIEAGQGQFEQAMEHYQRVFELVGPRREGLEARRRLPGLEEAAAKITALKTGLLVEACKALTRGLSRFRSKTSRRRLKPSAVPCCWMSRTRTTCSTGDSRRSTSATTWWRPSPSSASSNWRPRSAWLTFGWG